MPFCDNCGAEHPPSVHFCGACGAALLDESGHPKASSETLILLGYPISLKRILFMVVISYGLYIFYWYYLTWKQYRDHTNEVAYPVWHALTLLVFIYGLFRTHAHMRTFRKLMLNANMPSSISPRLAVIVVFVSSVLEGQFLRGTVLELIVIVLTSGLLLHVQSNINKYWTALISENEYWSSLPYPRKTPLKVGWGEVIFGIIGASLWLNTFLYLFSESWRMGL